MKPSLHWYLSLDIHTRINLKECSELIVGFKFGALSFIFSFKERVEILYNKLIIEGII